MRQISNYTAGIPTSHLWFLAACLVLLFSLGFAPERSAFVSHEVRFTDNSWSGLAILPASCSSHPSYTHGALSETSDAFGYVSTAGQSEYGSNKGNLWLCITNATGANYFVPAKTAAEINAFVSAAGPLPNLDAWGTGSF